ncbi:MAG: hypothetical protein J6D08_09475 [Lachnospiraceae bacterium]|nr:hypothetical protein [Lachnospiraceae bacterium]
MNYQQVTADAINQILFQTADAAATTDAATGFGFLSFCSAAADAATMDAAAAMDADAVVTTTTDAATGFGFLSSSSAAAVSAATTDADAAKQAPAKIHEGSYNTNPLNLRIFIVPVITNAVISYI